MNDTSGQAYPFVVRDCRVEGLTKRELFAAMAMQGQLGDNSRNGTPAEYADWSVKLADALLAALKGNRDA